MKDNIGIQLLKENSMIVCMPIEGKNIILCVSIKKYATLKVDSNVEFTPITKIVNVFPYFLFKSPFNTPVLFEVKYCNFFMNTHDD